MDHCRHLLKSFINNKLLLLTEILDEMGWDEMRTRMIMILLLSYNDQGQLAHKGRSCDLVYERIFVYDNGHGL